MVAQAQASKNLHDTARSLRHQPHLVKAVASKVRGCSLRGITICFFITFVLFNGTTRMTLEENPQSKASINGARTSNSGKGRRIAGPFDDTSSVFVIQAADGAYAEKMKSLMEINKKWAGCTNYTYELKTLSSTGNVYSQKVQAIHDALESAKENDWIIYLDADVFYKADSCDALENMLPTESKSSGQLCEFISMTSSHTINTGVLLLKSSHATKQLVRKWLEEQRKPDKLLSFGAADQLSLQEAVMGNVLGASYTGRCSNLNDQSKRNYCFQQHIPEEYRSLQNMCLIPCNDKVPLQCQDCNGECNRTLAVFKHDSKRERYVAKHGYPGESNTN
eukprot:CAMPEP_0172568714 /NCGR_PEP_ID=MMETSP1067-20121228/120860_1 /TAXON_ID=265564 ORGANISM="Thalassiosira punctigera, Strain Tpunct2005C2" /NCGR_SAMPLE_ID=MMETSP1067 /ASSEMBLY_ACC=CAM_ASM_000444 /LENGTH=334 /DNA_ID=CAMNT_0013360379 /DNA_START=77 /DNA_END=1078 /DNA_ORIENTATION=-